MTAYAASPSYAYQNMIRVGTGSDTPTAADYQLTTSGAINYLSVANEELVYNLDSGTATKTVKMSIQNNSANPVTLREWGILNRVGYDTSYNLYTGDILLYRDLFASPVVLDAYESATLTLTLTLTLNDPL